jgi:hypothetical protein
MRHRALALVAVGLLIGLGIRAEEPASDAAVVTDSAGKEIKITSFKPTNGARRLSWLADPKGMTDDLRKGPHALELREINSTTFSKGVVTLVPLSGIESIRYEYDKHTLAVSVKGAAEPLTGTLQYKGINVLAFDADAGGITGKFTGGVPGTGIKSIAFSGAKPLAARPSGGASWAVQIVQPTANHPTLMVRNLKPLFALPGGGETLLDAIPTRKGDPIALTTAGVKRLEILAVDPNTQMAAVEIQSDDGPERVVMVPLTRDHEKKTATLIGLLGEVDAGWKLFPLHAIKVITPEAKKP